MKLAAKVALVLSLVLVGLGFTDQWNAPTYMIKISQKEFRAHENEIRSRGFDIAGVDLHAGEVYLLVSASEQAVLGSLGVQVGASAVQVPRLSPDSKYKTPDQVMQLLQKYAADYPALASVSVFGKSLEGRDIPVLKITGASGAGKPAILFNGMHHAREVMTPEVPLDIAEQLLAGYGRDPKITRWVDNFEIYIAPMLNVDGNHRVWEGENMWRKNTRGSWGVDLNRNYPYMWDACNGSSGYEIAQDYRGPSAASEPETNALMSLVASIRPVFNISFHSFSELVIYPYGCGDHTEQKDVVEPIGQAIAELLPSDDGRGTYSAGTAPELLYNADGGDIDWMYNEYNVLAYVIELNSARQGFQPPYDQWRDKTVQKLRPAWQYLLERMEGSSIRGRIEGQGPFAIRTGGRILKVRADGVFHLIVNPGEYDVEFLSGDQVVAQKRIVVGNAPVSVNVR